MQWWAKARKRPLEKSSKKAQGANISSIGFCRGWWRPGVCLSQYSKLIRLDTQRLMESTGCVQRTSQALVAPWKSNSCPLECPVTASQQLEATLWLELLSEVSYTHGPPVTPGSTRVCGSVHRGRAGPVRMLTGKRILLWTGLNGDSEIVVPGVRGKRA